MGGINLVQNGRGSFGGTILGVEGYITASGGKYNPAEYNVLYKF
jgi:hypothetical protein